MSVYIKGMEMPKSCFYCPFRLKFNPDEIKCLATREEFEETFSGTIETRNRGNCPLIEVPPHGRLIDADAFERKVMFGDEEDLQDVIYSLRDYPSIIPADKEDRQ